MPEPYAPKKGKNAYTLEHARQFYEVAEIKCRYCKTVRYFAIADLKVLFGDIECDDVVYQPGWNCEQCNRDAGFEFELKKPSAEERQKMVIRRIEEIKYVRKIKWRDERP